MNTILFLLAIGSVEPSSAAVARPAPARLDAQAHSAETNFVFQQGGKVSWPKWDPRDPSTREPRTTEAGQPAGRPPRGAARNAQGSAPAIAKSQFKDPVPSYQPDESDRPPQTAPLVKPADSRFSEPARESEEDRALSSPRSNPSYEERGAGRARSEQPASRPNRLEQFVDLDEEPATNPSLRTSARRQSISRLDGAPGPYEFRSARGSDDSEDSDRVSPIKSFAIQSDEGEEDLGVEPYDEPLRTRPSGNRIAQNDRGNRDIRDTDLRAEDGANPSQQGSKKMPDSGNGWILGIVSLLLFASMGANAYLAWTAREFYERYRSLAQQMRAARNSLT